MKWLTGLREHDAAVPPARDVIDIHISVLHVADQQIQVLPNEHVVVLAHPDGDPLLDLAQIVPWRRNEAIPKNRFR